MAINKYLPCQHDNILIKNSIHHQNHGYLFLLLIGLSPEVALSKECARVFVLVHFFVVFAVVAHLVVALVLGLADFGAADSALVFWRGLVFDVTRPLRLV